MYKITILSENCAYGHHVRGEHGLSLYIESPTHKLLLDTGASDLFIDNARRLKIDLTQVDHLILSHGHSDHTGGVAKFLRLNSRATVICKREILTPKFKGERENGFKGVERLDLSRFEFIDSFTEIAPYIYILPKIEITNPDDTHFDRFMLSENGVMSPDRFEDELAVVLRSPEGVSILSACSHRGITNIIGSVQGYFPDEPMAMLLGGFHIHNAPDSDFETIAAYLQQHSPKSIGVCHCTGVDKFALFRERFGERAFYAHCGMVIDIE